MRGLIFAVVVFVAGVASGFGEGVREAPLPNASVNVVTVAPSLADMLECATRPYQDGESFRYCLLGAGLVQDQWHRFDWPDVGAEGTPGLEFVFPDIPPFATYVLDFGSKPLMMCGDRSINCKTRVGTDADGVVGILFNVEGGGTYCGQTNTNGQKIMIRNLHFPMQVNSANLGGEPDQLTYTPVQFKGDEGAGQDPSDCDVIVEYGYWGQYCGWLDAEACVTALEILDDTNVRLRETMVAYDPQAFPQGGEVNGVTEKGPIVWNGGRFAATLVFEGGGTQIGGSIAGTAPCIDHAQHATTTTKTNIHFLPGPGGKDSAEGRPVMDNCTGIVVNAAEGKGLFVSGAVTWRPGAATNDLFTFNNTSCPGFDQEAQADLDVVVGGSFDAIWNVSGSGACDISRTARLRMRGVNESVTIGRLAVHAVGAVVNLRLLSAELLFGNQLGCVDLFDPEADIDYEAADQLRGWVISNGTLLRLDYAGGTDCT